MTTTTTPPTTPPPPGGGSRPDVAPRATARHGGRPGVPRFWWWLGAVTAAALAVRLTYLLGWRTPWPVIGDPYYYHRGANLLADGEGYIHPYQFLLYGRRLPGADHPPGYMTVLAASSWLGLRSFFQHQVVSCLLGAAGVLAMGVAGRRIAGERVALIVAALAALSPNLFYFDAMVVSETLMVATTATVLLAAYRWWDRPGAASAALFGVVVGLAALVRSESILLAPAIAVPLVWLRARRPPAAGGVATGDGGAPPGGEPVPRRRLRLLRRGPAAELAVAAVAVAVVVAPWVGYNLARFEEPVTLSAQLDQTLGTANCESVYEGDRVGYWSLACIQETEHLVPEGDASAQGKGFREIAVRYARDHRDRVPYVVAARVGRTFGLYQPQEQLLLDRSVDQKETVLGQVGMAAWYGIAVTGALGLVGLRRAGRPIFPLLAVVASVVVVTALVYGNTRFRLPAELALMFPAAVTLDAGLAGARRRWDRWREDRREAPRPTSAGHDDHGEGGQGAAPAPAAAIGGAGAGVAADPPGGLGSSTGRFAGFDGLRALAALGVLVTHVGLRVGFTTRDATGDYLARLDVGIAVFFVLSGFLLYRPFVARRLDGRPRPGTRDYLRNRFLRIFPAYWLAFTVLTVVLDVRGRDEVQGLWDFVTFYGLLQSYSAHTALGGLQQAWTLTNEVAFYLVLPLWALGAAWLGRRLPPRRAVAAEVGALVVAATAGLAFRYWVHTVDTSDVTLGTIDPRVHWLPANFHMFVPGMALAVLLEWSRRRPRPLPLLEVPRRHPLACWAGAAACFWAASTRLGLGFEVGAGDPSTAIVKELLYTAVGLLVVLPVALAGATLPRSLRWLGSRPMVVLGMLSYGIYLWHEGVLDIYRDIRDLPVFTGSMPAALLATVAGSVAAAGLSYVLVERPALALKDRHHRLFATWRPAGLPDPVVPR
ncbi:MAG TPA: acyltransferase family protein [Acidimicrobiales bacterium]|nr:acyltransferase family protein [Acidimicrobiales bacterium]